MLNPESNPLACLFIDAASRYPDRVALRSPGQDITYAQLLALSVGLARRLRSVGVGRDALVGLKLTGSDGVGAIASILALTLQGAQWMQYALYPEGLSIELTHLMHDEPVRAGSGRLLSVDIRPLLAEAAGDPVPEDLDDLVGYRSADDTWALSASSGTTGLPKCMKISGRMFHGRLERLREAWGTTPQFTATDLFARTSNMGCTNFMYTLFAGGTYLLQTDFDYLVGQDVDMIVGSPALLAGFLVDRSVPAKPCLKEVHVGGAVVSRAFFSRLLKYFGTVTVRYGATETGPVSCRTSRTDDHSNSVGASFPDVMVQVITADDEPAAAGVEGTVRIRTATAVEGYLGDSETSAEAFRDGWFYPGDRGYLSAEGELFITGRSEDQLNVSGTKVNAARIDDHMRAADGVADALCFEELDGQGVVRLAALVCPDPGAADTRAVMKNLLKALLRQQLHPSMLPGNIYQVAEIPRNANGKPMRHRAAALVEGRSPVARFGRNP